MTNQRGFLGLAGMTNGNDLYQNQQGQVELDKVMPPTAENAARRREILELDQEFRKRMSPRGELNLPPLLDQRRLEWGIIDAAFSRQATFDRVTIWQIPEQKTETFGEGSLIVMSDQSKSRLKNEAPRGILLTAGLKALDSLRSNGMELGHIVSFIQAAPWRIFVDYVKGHRPAILVMNVGDIMGSEDLALQTRSGELREELKETAQGAMQHVYVNRDGKYHFPVQPWIGDDM